MKPIFAILTTFMITGLVLNATLSPLPPSGIHGRYNYNSRLAYCESRVLCLHEIGHALDQAAGFPSQGREFGDALGIHLAVALHNDRPEQFSMQILRDLTGYADDYRVKSELYANLFMASGGEAENLPADLRPFYDWYLAARLLGRWREGQDFYWLGE